MKYKFSKSVPFIPAWNKNQELPDTDQVKTVLKPMELNDLFTLMDATGGGDTGQIDFRKMRDLIANAGHLLPKYCVLSGLEADEGPVTTDDLLRYPAFLELATELLIQMANISLPSQSAEGNSATQPALAQPTQGQA